MPCLYFHGLRLYIMHEVQVFQKIKPPTKDGLFFNEDLAQIVW